MCYILHNQVFSLHKRDYTMCLPRARFPCLDHTKKMLRFGAEQVEEGCSFFEGTQKSKFGDWRTRLIEYARLCTSPPTLETWPQCAPRRRVRRRSRVGWMRWLGGPHGDGRRPTPTVTGTRPIGQHPVCGIRPIHRASRKKSCLFRVTVAGRVRDPQLCCPETGNASVRVEKSAD